jgi:uncharacterized protein YhbP (UPF0306 family)
VGVTIHSLGYDSDRLFASMARILDANTMCSMATRNEAGTLHINTVYFCFSHDLNFYFLSHPDSLHSRNLARVPQMAVAVVDSHQRWGDPHSGLQLHGPGRLTDPDAGEARELYSERFPRYREFLRRALEAPPRSSTFGDLRFYCFSPKRAQILDEWEFGEEVFIPADILR